MARIVGLCGYSGAGKSEIAKHLEMNHCWKRHRFAGALKEMCRAIGLTDEHIEGKLKKLPCAMLGGKTPQYFMQRLGTEFGREMIDPDLWVNIWQASLPNGPCPGIVVEDVRFANERLAIKRLDGMLIEVHRPGVEAQSSHPSEHGTGYGAHIIINDKGVADLQRRVDWLLKLGG